MTRHVLFALACLTAAPSSAQVVLPRILTAPIIPACTPTPEDQLTWRAWPDAEPSSVVEEPAARAGVVARAGGAWGDVGRVASRRPPGESWTMIVEGARHFGITRGRLEGSPQCLPPIHLVALPLPTARASGGEVEIAWQAAPLDDLGEGIEVLRTTDAVTWQSLGRVAPGTGAFVDREAPPSALYALRLVLSGDLVGRERSAPAAVGLDSDADGIPDSLDRCAAFADPAQIDANADGVSDACEFTWGDVHPTGQPDGVVGAGDVVRLMRFAVGLETPDAREFRAADVAPADQEAGGGLAMLVTPRPQAAAELSIDDVTLVLRAAVGLTRFSTPH